MNRRLVTIAAGFGVAVVALAGCGGSSGQAAIACHVNGQNVTVTMTAGSSALSLGSAGSLGMQPYDSDNQPYSNDVPFDFKDSDGNAVSSVAPGKTVTTTWNAFPAGPPPAGTTCQVTGLGE